MVSAEESPSKAFFSICIPSLHFCLFQFLWLSTTGTREKQQQVALVLCTKIALVLCTNSYIQATDSSISAIAATDQSEMSPTTMLLQAGCRPNSSSPKSVLLLTPSGTAINVPLCQRRVRNSLNITTSCCLLVSPGISLSDSWPSHFSLPSKKSYFPTAVPITFPVPEGRETFSVRKES